MSQSRLSALLADPEVQAAFEKERARLTRAAMHANTHEASRDAWQQFQALQQVERALKRAAKDNNDD